ncbi:unnamed protein product, partial [Ixodes hexagonus]
MKSMFGQSMPGGPPADPFYSSPFSPYFRRHTPYFGQPDYRIYEMNKRLQQRTEESDNLWWDAFATEFFEDDATLTLTFCLEDGPKRYTIGRTLIPRYFRSIFEGGVTDLYFNLKHPKESFHNTTITLDCDQCTMVTHHGKASYSKRANRLISWERYPGSSRKKAPRHSAQWNNPSRGGRSFKTEGGLVSYLLTLTSRAADQAKISALSEWRPLLEPFHCVLRHGGISWLLLGQCFHDIRHSLHVLDKFAEHCTFFNFGTDWAYPLTGECGLGGQYPADPLKEQLAKDNAVIVCTEGRLILEFTFDDLMRIKSWHFATRTHRELVPRSLIAIQCETKVRGQEKYDYSLNPASVSAQQQDPGMLEQLSKNITRQGLSNSTLNYLRLCVILEPMQELMSRHKAYALSPRDCLKTTLFQKWQRMVAPPGVAHRGAPNDLKSAQDIETQRPPSKRRKRKSSAANNAGNASNAGSGGKKKNMSPGPPNFSLASQ